jgi:hypothetical protein
MEKARAQYVPQQREPVSETVPLRCPIRETVYGNESVCPLMLQK